MAGTIESLDFEVILKDDKFKKSIDNDLKLARELNTKLTDILNLKKRLNNETTTQLVNAEKVRQAEAKTAQEIAKTALEQQKVATEVERTRILQEKHTGAAKKTTAEYVNMKSVLRTLSQLTGVTFSVVGIRRFLESMIDITGQFEVQRMALRNMLQDVDGADKIFEDLYRFSSDSTYRFSELAKYAKQLSAFNIDKGSLLETTKMLGDVASGVGVSMDRLILAYGHVKSSGFLRGIQLRSFSQNGVPILEELSKMFTETEKRAVSLGDVFDRMMKREIPFEMVEEAFRRMTSEGGKFYQMQEVLAKTLAGQINILKGRWENMLAAIGQSNSGIFKGVVSDISTALVHYERVGKTVLELVSVFGAYKAALFIAEAAVSGLTAAEAAQIGVMNILNKTILANPYALLAAALTTVGYAIYRVVDGMESMTDIQKTLRLEQSKYTTDLTKSVSELDLLYGKLKLAAQGTDEYNTAVRSIQSRYGDYIEQLRGEGVAVDNLAEIYDKLREKVENAAKARFVASARSALDQTYGEQIGEIFDKNGRFSMTRVVNQLDLDAKEAGFLKMMIAGVTSEEDLRKLEEAATLFEKIDNGFVSYGAGDTGPVRAAKYIENLRKRVAELNKEYNDGKAVVDSFAEALVAASDGGGKGGELFYKIPEIIDDIKNIDKDIKAIRDKAKSSSITVDEKKALDALVADRKEQTDLYKSIMGVDYDKDTRRSASTSEKAEEKARNAIKANIALLEKYLDIYKRVEKIEGENPTSFLIGMFGGDEAKYKNLEGQIKTLTTELRGMGEEGERAADAIEARLGLDAVSQLEKADKAAKKAAEDYEKAEQKITDYLAKDFGVEGERVAAKVTKALSDLNTKNAGVDSGYAKLVAELEKERQKVVSDYIAEGHSEDEANAYWDAYSTRRKKELRDKANEEIEQNKRVTKERIRGMAKELFGEQMEGFDLTNWTDKTISQIQAIREAMENVNLPEDLKKSLLKDFEIAKLLFEELKKIAGENLENTVKPEEGKAWARTAQQVAGYMSKAASSMREFAEATGNVALADVASAVGAISETLSAAAAGFQAGGVWGAVIAGALDIFTQIVNSVSEAEAEARKLRDRVREIRYEVEMTKYENQLEDGVNGLFGENFIRGVRNAVDGITEANEQMRKASGLMEKYKTYVRMGSDASFGYWPLLSRERGDAAIVTSHSFWNGNSWSHLSEIAEQLGMELYGEGGFLNPELIKKVIELYGGLNENALDWLKQEQEAAEKYNKAIEDIKDATKELFDSLSSDMTTEFIDNFKEMGNAVDDLGSVFENLGETILRSLLQSYILDEILKQYESEAQNALRSYAAGDMTPEAYAEWLRGFTERVEGDAERNADAINSMIAAFADRGLLGMDSDSSDANSLGNGIKGITEETASLLASYINAIRADVSVMRALQEKGWENIAALAGVITPTLADYVQQIAANTANAAQDTNAILAELRSVIGPAGTTGDVLRVEMA